MANTPREFATLEDWIAREAIPFSSDSPNSLNAAIDRVVAALGHEVELLGFGEPLHGESIFLRLRNQIFKRLIEKHGYSAIAIESSFPRSPIVNNYVLGNSHEPIEAVQTKGFSHNFGALNSTRELLDWMRAYNADPKPLVPLHFYGFDSPTEMMYADSPRQLLYFVLDYLESIDFETVKSVRKQIDLLLGNDADWENTAAAFDATKSIGQSPAALELQAIAESLIADLQSRREQLIVATDEARYFEAMHYAKSATQQLKYHAGMASSSENRIADLLSLRDQMMADNLEHIASRERTRDPQGGRVFVFAHNGHLKLGPMEWQLGPNRLIWSPAGRNLNNRIGRSYAVIGCGVVQSEEHGINTPEAGTLEAKLAGGPGPMRMVPTYCGKCVPRNIVEQLPTRSGSTTNSTYFPFTAASVSDFDFLLT